MLAWTPASGAYVSSTHSALYPVPSARVVGTSGPRGPVVVPRVVTSMGVASTLGSNKSRAPLSGIKGIAAPPLTCSADGTRSATPPRSSPAETKEVIQPRPTGSAPGCTVASLSYARTIPRLRLPWSCMVPPSCSLTTRLPLAALTSAVPPGPSAVPTNVHHCWTPRPPSQIDPCVDPSPPRPVVASVTVAVTSGWVQTESLPSARTVATTANPAEVTLSPEMVIWEEPTVHVTPALAQLAPPTDTVPPVVSKPVPISGITRPTVSGPPTAEAGTETVVVTLPPLLSFTVSVTV